MWIDTHCHLDAPEFGGDAGAVWRAALAAGVSQLVLPAVERSNFATVQTLATQYAGVHFALGIHPMYVAHAHENDLHVLRAAVELCMQDEASKLLAIGEVGLDLFVPALQTGELRAKQEYFYVEQLKLARAYGLPVLLHVRRAQDQVLKQLRRIRPVGGIAHAFNGSMQQAQTFIDLGFMLGFGGALTYSRALQIRRLATELPLSALVLETDAPDIAPSWLTQSPNAPAELPRIGEELANLRGLSMAELAAATCANARAVLPRLSEKSGL